MPNHSHLLSFTLFNNNLYQTKFILTFSQSWSLLLIQFNLVYYLNPYLLYTMVLNAQRVPYVCVCEKSYDVTLWWCVAGTLCLLVSIWTTGCHLRAIHWESLAIHSDSLAEREAMAFVYLLYSMLCIPCFTTNSVTIYR